MALTPPPAIPADGSWRVWFVPTMADPAVPDISTDINGASTVDASCLFTKDGLAPSVNQDKYSDERLCTIQVFEQLGAVTYGFDDVTYVADPQTPASATNKLYAAVGAGAIGYLVIRWGMSAETTPAAAQKVWVFPVAFGPSVPLPPETNSATRVTQALSVTGTVQRDVALVA